MVSNVKSSRVDVLNLHIHNLLSSNSIMRSVARSFINPHVYLINMSTEEVKGRGKQIKGQIREEVGKLTNNKTEQVKGKIEQVEGKVQEEIGKLKRKAKE